MLGLSNPNDLDELSLDCFFPPCPDSGKNKVQRPILDRSPRSQHSGLQQPWERSMMPPVTDPSVSLRGQTSTSGLEMPTLSTLSDQANNCNCDQVKTQVSELEEELKVLSNEMNTALAGMRSSMTALLRRIETLETSQMEMSGEVACVATKEALHLPGMDGWCKENCRKGNCPSHLCSCPVSNIL